MELIDKGELLQVLQERYIAIAELGVEAEILELRKVMEIIKEHPAVEKRKKGKWLATPELWNFWCCSECGKHIYSASGGHKLDSYCPHCGAEMEKSKAIKVMFGVMLKQSMWRTLLA